MMKQPVVLIVDDNPENLSLLADLLDKNGCDTILAQDGAMALESIKNEHPNLILLDIMMPGMDGFEVCRRLKQDILSANIPIIFLTAKQEKSEVIAGLKLGAVDYITKPFNQEELLVRVNTHLELQAAKEKLQEALVTKDKLFSIIGHDLGNLFFILQGLAEILVTKGTQMDAKEREKDLQMLMQSANNGYDLLTNLLNWSKSQTGRLQSNPTTLTLQDLIYRNLELQYNTADRKEINIFANIGENISVFADKNMLNTVFRNLISNAIKFTQKSGTIRITAEPIEDNVVEISITDTGIGIKSEDINKMFRVNVAHTYGTASEKGNGLGLVLCKELIEKCNGTIGVESEVGVGSRFYVCLPINIEP
ncbi:hybrid sensor histidine kinase/response regulator [Candidatus Parabeggiatoa sp. HSG14]|uniref:hybrid sensor histidine kinase/response regulator n=1 Tax=Candidatus Parabeggiatoa sp. HSG14 TaxID=3055593 RepID=UPI0025A791BE|nr:hybrid sensor histidine kinase/response regulator [Thiotrichales bacterium HSG14]